MSVFTNPSSGATEHAEVYTTAVLKLVGTRSPLEILRSTATVVRERLAALSTNQLLQREAPGKWSIGHVVQHLADAELATGWRLRLVLAQDRPALTGYDQDLWAERLYYDRSDVWQALEEFEICRRSNLRLIEQATPADLRRVGVHGERGEQSVELMVRMSAGHDLLHLQQIERIRTATIG
jgi:hypothetical protein